MRREGWGVRQGFARAGNGGGVFCGGVEASVRAGGRVFLTSFARYIDWVVFVTFPHAYTVQSMLIDSSNSKYVPFKV